MDLGGRSVAPDAGTVMMTAGMAASGENEAACYEATLGARMQASMSPGSFAMNERA